MKMVFGVVTLAVSLAMPASAQRVDMGAIGNDDGGAPFRLECPEGEFMVGAAIV